MVALVPYRMSRQQGPQTGCAGYLW